MAWRVAKSLLKLQTQLDDAAPARAKPDGFIGDADHANRTSDHNPWCAGEVVTAGDFKDDDRAGANMRLVAESLRRSRDRRIKYVIHEGKMFSSYPTSTYGAWEWRPYSGPNGHFTHMHVSVQCNASKDSTKDWQIGEWSDMASKAEIRQVVKEEINKAVKKLAVGKSQEGWNSDRVNLKAAIEGKK